MSHSQPDDFDPPLPESDEGYDAAEQAKLDSLTDAEWIAVLRQSPR